jgi:DNA primase
MYKNNIFTFFSKENISADRLVKTYRMTIEEIKERLNIKDVLAHYGIVINKNHHINCPFHEDKTPSMKVYEETNTVYCFSGNCGTHGSSLDVIEFVIKKESCTKHEAILKCKAMLNYEAPKKVAAPNQAILGILWEEFKKSYKNKQCKGSTYATQRGLTGIEIGYNVGSWHRKKGVSKKDLEAAKEVHYLLPSLANRGMKVWAVDCLIFALRNAQNEVVSFYGRSVNSEGHFYLKDRQGLYPNYPKLDSKKVLLTESIIDAASLLNIASIVDNYSVLALYGTNGLTSEHRAALANLTDLEEIVLLLDGDEAGRQASKKLGDFLAKEYPNTVIKIAELPNETDVNELWVNHLSEDLFLELIEQARLVQTVEKPSLDLKIVNSNYYTYEMEKLKIEVLGGINIEALDKMTCTLRLTRKPKRNSLDKLRQSLNLYHSGQVKSLIKRVQEEFELSLQELRLIFADLIENLELYRSREQGAGEENKIQARVLSPGRKKIALDYAKAENLMQNTWDALGKVGVVGERMSAMIMYLCFSSRKLSKPLHIISLGSSGSGKTHLQETIAELIPEQEIMSITSLSDNAMYYYPEGALEHSLFLIEDMDGMSEDANYALRELKSKGELSRDIPVKDYKGKLTTQKVKVKGPICFAGCTTREKIYEDNANRCLLLYRNESKAHKEEVMAAQRKASAGKINELEQQKIKDLFKDVQMLLKPIKVVNPYAEQLILPEKVFKPLRTNAHYLKFIEVITFYHQHQRTIKTSQSGTKYIETTIEDIEWANKLMKDVLLSKSDELSWGARQFFERLKVWLQADKLESFKSNQIRDAFRMSPSTIKKYFRMLLQYNRIEIIGGSRYKGLEYILKNESDYKALQSMINTALDTVLEDLKKQFKDK